jgi:hypothetical protein
MRLGDLLIQAKLVTADNVAIALRMQAVKGGRLGDHLVASGAIDPDVLHAFLHRIPAEPSDIQATGIDGITLMGLLIKSMYVGHLETVPPGC